MRMRYEWYANDICKKLFGRINHHQLLSEYILHNFFCFLSNMINCQEQLKAIQQTEKKKKCTSFLGVCIVSLIALCDTIYKWLYDASKFLLVLAFFGAFEMTAHVKEWLMLF